MSMKFSDLDLYLSQYNLNTRQFLVIAAAQSIDHPASFHEISEILGMSYNSAKQVASKLETMGYIEFEPDPDDPRKQRIRLTEKNTEFWGSHDEENRHFMENQFSNLSSDEANQLFGLLGKVFRG